MTHPQQTFTDTDRTRSDGFHEGFKPQKAHNNDVWGWFPGAVPSVDSQVN